MELVVVWWVLWSWLFVVPYANRMSCHWHHLQMYEAWICQNRCTEWEWISRGLTIRVTTRCMRRRWNVRPWSLRYEATSWAGCVSLIFCGRMLRNDHHVKMDVTRVLMTGIRYSSNCSHEVRNLKLKRSGGSSDIQGDLSTQMIVLVSSRFDICIYCRWDEP